MAAGRNPDRPSETIFHSDRGCQYTAKKIKELVESLGFRKSMFRPWTPRDNQPIESFLHTLEVEMPDIRHLNFEEASRTIINYIELYYNSERLHAGINYSVSNQFLTLLSVQNSWQVSAKAPILCSKRLNNMSVQIHIEIFLLHLFCYIFLLFHYYLFTFH